MGNDFSKHVYPPERAVDTTLAYVEEQLLNPVTGVKAIIPGMAGKLDTWKAGDLVGVLAYTSNGKTSFVNYIINQLAMHLRNLMQKDEHNHIIVQFSWEQPIEQMIGVDLSRVTGVSVSDILYGRVNDNQLKQMKEKGQFRKELPIWLVGHSIHDSRTRPRLAMDDVNIILTWIENECGMKIDLIVLDYLQRIRYYGSDRVEGMIRNCDDARTMALRCPVLLLSQAKRECFERTWAMPRLDDSQWSSNFEQSCTHIHALWRPFQNRLSTIKVNGQSYNVSEDMLLHEILKQTLGPINFVTVYQFGYGGTFLREWDSQQPAQKQF